MTLTDPNTSQANGAPSPLMARAVDLVKSYGSGDAEVRAMNGINVEFARGQLTAVMGPSGSGKSTLMHCMAGLHGRTGCPDIGAYVHRRPGDRDPR